MILVSIVMTLGLLAAALPGGADADRADPGNAATVAPVVVDGAVLFKVRGATSYPAMQRARDVARRIADLASDPAVDPASLRIEASEIGPRITFDDGSVTIITATASDARQEGLSQDELATIYLGRIRKAIQDYRALRTADRILTAAAVAAAATALFVILLLAGRWAFRRLDLAISRRIEDTVERLRIQSFRLISAEQAWMMLRAAIRSLRVASGLVLVYAYLNFTLSLFPWTRGFAVQMLELVLDPLALIGLSVVASVPDLVFLFVLAVVTRLVLRAIRLFFTEIDRGRVTFESFDRDWAMPTYRLVRMLVIGFAVVVAFPYIPGSDSGAFKGITIFAGVLFSLGSSSVIGNIIAGYTMTYRRAFRDGDRIRVGDVVGEVTDTRLLVTTVRTPKNEEVVIPNSVILGNEVVNYSARARAEGLILHTTVGIGYEVPWRQVEAMLLLAAERTDGLLSEPPPFVLETALGDFAVTYELNVYCDAPDRIPRLYAELHRRILDVFNEYGVQIMTPAYEDDTPEPKLVPKDQWFAAPARQPDPSD